jgi:hypothetical protein
MLRIEPAYPYPSDIQRLLKAAGFREVTIKGRFGGREFTRDGDGVVEAT